MEDRHAEDAGFGHEVAVEAQRLQAIGTRVLLCVLGLHLQLGMSERESAVADHPLAIGCEVDTEALRLQARKVLTQSSPSGSWVHTVGMSVRG